jgi:hypothetical protein
MWIKTKGGYLLNTDNVEYIIYNDGNTYASGLGLDHIIADYDCVDYIFDNLNRGAAVMEVR